MKFSNRFLELPKPAVIALCFLTIFVIGISDYFTKWEVSLFIFYGFPIFGMAWHIDRRWGIVAGLACAIVWYFANLDTHPFTTTAGYVWATVNRMVYFIFTAIGGAAMRQQREENRARLAAMARTRELEQEIVRVSEREQIRIGQDLHDSLCQNLVAIDCAAACLKSDLEAQQRPEAREAASIQKMLRDAVLEARGIARGISPLPMDSESLPAAVNELAETSRQIRRVPISVKVSGAIDVPDPHDALHIYRIVQEALSNALRHSNATQIVITLDQEGADLSVSISDNGSGLPASGIHAHGMGLHTMRYRAQLLGTTLQTIRNPEGGTTISFKVSLSHERKS